MLGTLIGGTKRTDRVGQIAGGRAVARAEETSVARRDEDRLGTEPAPRAQILVPRDSQGTTVNIFWGDRDRLPDLKPRRISGRLAFALKALAMVAFVGAIHWGPSYYSCRQMKDRGMFYYGTTISSCMGEKIDARNAYFETLGRKLIPAL